MTDKQETPRTDDLRKEIDGLPKFGHYGYRADAYAELVFKRFPELERELAALRASIEAAEMPEEPKEFIQVRASKAQTYFQEIAIAYIDKLRAKLEAVTAERDIHRRERSLLSAAFSAKDMAWRSQVERATEAEAKLAAERDKALEFRNLVDGAVKILWLAVPETREPVSESSHNPITAWVAKATRALKPTGKV